MNTTKTIMAVAAVALFCVNTKAGDDNLYVHHDGEVNHYIVSRGLDKLGEAAVRKEAREEAQEYAEYLATLAAEKAAKAKELQEAYVRQDLRNQARDKAFAEYAAQNPNFYHTDALPLANQCDDVATIKIYLYDEGYNVSDEQATQVRSYMLAHGLKHVSEIL